MRPREGNFQGVNLERTWILKAPSCKATLWWWLHLHQLKKITRKRKLRTLIPIHLTKTRAQVHPRQIWKTLMDMAITTRHPSCLLTQTCLMIVTGLCPSWKRCLAAAWLMRAIWSLRYRDWIVWWRVPRWRRRWIC